MLQRKGHPSESSCYPPRHMEGNAGQKAEGKEASENWQHTWKRLSTEGIHLWWYFACSSSVCSLWWSGAAWCIDVFILQIMGWGLGGSRKASILQQFGCDEAKGGPSRYAKYSQSYNLYPQWICRVLEGAEKQHISGFDYSIRITLTQWGIGGTRENLLDGKWMDHRYYKSVIPWDDSPLDRGEGRDMEVEIRSCRLQTSLRWS